MTKFIHYVWLALAIAAFIGVSLGATHHVFTFAISCIMFVATKERDKEEIR